MTMISLMPGRLDEGFARTKTSYRQLMGELFGPEYRARAPVEMGPLAAKMAFYRWLHSQGLNVREVPQYAVKAAADRDPSTAGGDPIGYRKGNVILIAEDYKGRQLNDTEMLAIAAHEHGHGASRSEEGAQEAAKRVMRVFGDVPALEVLDLFDRNLRKAGMPYNLN